MSENPYANESVDSEMLIDRIAEKSDSVTRLVNTIRWTFSLTARHFLRVAEKSLCLILSLDPEPLSFSDLPNDILCEIVEKLDLVSRLRTRKVSRNLRNVVDKQKAIYHKLSIIARQNRLYITFGEMSVAYKNMENGCLLEYGKDAMTPWKRKFIQENFLEIALNDLAITMKKTKFQLESLDLSFDIYADAETAKILQFLKSLKSPIHVKYLKITSPRSCDTLSILSLMESGTLEKVELGGVNKGLNVNELVKMDQWKEAKEVSPGNIQVRFEDFLHFDRFDIIVDSISPQDVLRLRDVLSKSKTFKICFLETLNFLNIHGIAIALGSTVYRDFFPRLEHRHRIHGTNEFLDFEIFPRRIHIKRTC